MKYRSLTIGMILAILSSDPLVARANERELLTSHGEIENGIYRNSYFGLEFPIPEGWSVLSHDKTQAIGPSIDLLSISKYPPGQTGNLMLSITTGDLSVEPPGASAERYVQSQFEFMVLMEIADPKVKPETSVMSIGGKEFVASEFQLAGDFAGETQSMVAHHFGRYVLVFIFSTSNEVEEGELVSILKNVSFR